MKKYYYLVMVRKNNSVPLLLKDDSILWALTRIARTMECLIDKNVSISTKLPKGKVNGSWTKIGSVKLTNKVETGKSEEEKIDVYLTRSRTGKLPPLITTKGALILDPIEKARHMADEGELIPINFIGVPKFYKCEVNFVLVQTGTGL